MSERKTSISVEDVGFFEGAEKLLEMWFYLSAGESEDGHTCSQAQNKGLRLIPRYIFACIFLAPSYAQLVEVRV